MVMVTVIMYRDRDHNCDCDCDRGDVNDVYTDNNEVYIYLALTMMKETKICYFTKHTNKKTVKCPLLANNTQSVSMDEVAEWLRRWTANPMCSARVGSNPILVE